MHLLFRETQVLLPGSGGDGRGGPSTVCETLVQVPGGIVVPPPSPDADSRPKCHGSSQAIYFYCCFGYPVTAGVSSSSCGQKKILAWTSTHHRRGHVREHLSLYLIDDHYNVLAGIKFVLSIYPSSAFLVIRERFLWKPSWGGTDSIRERFVIIPILETLKRKMNRLSDNLLSHNDSRFATLVSEEQA